MSSGPPEPHPIRHYSIASFVMALENKTVTLNGTEFILGKKYRDTILGNEGVATAGAAYLSGGDQLQLAWSGVNGEANHSWYDATRIEPVD